MMLGLISSASLRNEACAMVLAFAKVCPPPSAVSSKPVPEMQISKALDALYGQVAGYVQQNRLGIIGRARLAKALQHEMRHLKYPDELVSQLVNAVTVNALIATRQG